MFDMVMESGDASMRAAVGMRSPMRAAENAASCAREALAGAECLQHLAVGAHQLRHVLEEACASDVSSPLLQGSCSRQVRGLDLHAINA